DIMAESLDSLEIIQAVAAAALRQVHVRVLLDPGAAIDALQPLASAGAEVRIMGQGFSGSAIDTDSAHLLIGSAALSDVSLQQHREMGLLLTDGGANGAFENAFAADWSTATRVAVATPTQTIAPTATVGEIAVTPLPSDTPIRVRSTPTITPVPPTPTLPPTLTPSVLTITPRLYSSVRLGGQQQIVIETIPNAAVTVTVTYPDGATLNQGTTQGVADATGSFVDAWTIAPSTAPGTATVQITVSAIGQSKTITRTFTITL
ncbi:MAG TPA: phospholipase D-like domain-containing protein, partial [Chloroflexota bacterium]|nr:phospholipase D-like domain-containing protein [Chloroflexota bacterium]